MSSLSPDPWGQRYVPALSPRLKLLLALIFGFVAVLGATGAYLTSIRCLDYFTGQTYTKPFKYWMLILHVGVGLLGLLPFLAFGLVHWRTARNRPNRQAVKLGLAMFVVGVVVCLTGLALIRVEGLPQLRTDTTPHMIVLVLHVVLPILAVVLYVLHRRAGPDIRWRWGMGWGLLVGGFCIAMLMLHRSDPRQWHKVGSVEGQAYFRPSEALTTDGNFIPAEALMMDEYCMKCHQDIYQDHLHSAHKFSSFSNPAYLFSVQETRQVGRERDGHVKASRWCAGCHDPVPLFSGVFEDPRTDPKFDPSHERDQIRLARYQEVEEVLAGRKHPADSPISSAGVSCVVCHGITHVNSTIGNAAYTIEEPQHYPFAFSQNPLLQWINNQLIKAEPSFHKKTFLKPFHKTAEFCSTCHKVSLPVELNHYKEFLRGQNHYDTYLLSGASGVGVRSFYYPAKAAENCAACHMVPKASTDFGARDFLGNGGLQVHNHRFPAANTGLFALLLADPRYASQRKGLEAALRENADFLRGADPEGKDQKLRIDLFGIKEGGSIDGRLTVLRPELPRLKPGQSYLVEVVVRTLRLGHPFSQGTADSNEIWVDFEATSGERIIGRNGALSGPDESGEVDRWAHFINVLMLDRKGNRINRRNPQDIFVPLYDKQIPPGAASVVHYRLDVPKDVTAPIELKVRLRYRKFDDEYMKLVHGDRPVPKLPIVDICSDRVLLPVEGVSSEVPAQESPIRPAWQRWNDYGIGCYIEGGAAPTGLSLKRGEMKQALEAFRHLIRSGDPEAMAHGYLNAARVLIDDTGKLDEAADMLNEAAKVGAPWWTVTWFKALVASQNVTQKEQLDRAVDLLETIRNPANQPTDRAFDFRRDYVVLGQLGRTLFKRSQLELDDAQAEESYLLRAVEAYEKALAIDSEEVETHFGLFQCYDRLGRHLPEDFAAPGSPVPQVEAVEQSARELADPTRRADAVRRLLRDLPSFLSQPLSDYGNPPRLHPKLPTIRTVIPLAREAFRSESDTTIRQGLAQVLALLHNTSNAIYKIDDNARSYALTEYRRKHPAANHAAEAIVIYPTTPEQIRSLLQQGASATVEGQP
jgi:tetratricopeptide (TPR) repeat protein/mono/diheme cytochrome c family protein